MKRLLLNSSNIKPVNIRIVSNGMECADLKMLKENFCISDIKNVLDGRLVNWLSNIGEKELAESVKNKFPTPESITGKEIELYQLMGIIGKDVDVREYAKVLNNEKDHQIFFKEIKAIPNLILEIYQQFPSKYTPGEWINLFQIAPTTEQVLDTLQILEKQHEERIKQINEDSKNKFRDFLTFLIKYCKTHNVYYEGDKAKQAVSDYLDMHVEHEVYKRCGNKIIDGGLSSNMQLSISWELGNTKKMVEFNHENFNIFLKSILELDKLPYSSSEQREIVYEKFFVAYPYANDAVKILGSIWYCWEDKTLDERRNKINNCLKELNRQRFYL